MPFCPSCGREVAEGANFCQYCGAQLKPAQRTEKAAEYKQAKTKEIHIPYPEADDIRLEISVGIPGKLEIRRGETQNFVQGVIAFEEPEWEPIIDIREGSVRLLQEGRVFTSGVLHPDTSNRWELRIGDKKPFSLKIGSGVAQGKWQLGGLPITRLDINTGVADSELSFEKANPTAMEKMELGAGVGKLMADGLLNAGFRELRVTGAVGELKLRFSGKPPEKEAAVSIDGGIGGIGITVEANVPTRADVSGLTSVTTKGQFYRLVRRFPGGGEFQNEAYERTAGPALVLTIRMGVGGLTLETM